MNLLLAFDEMNPEYRVGELAVKLDLHQSTASRMVATLAARGFLERDSETGKLRLGPEVGRLGLLALGSRHNLAAVAQRPMKLLADRIGETVTLTVLDGEDVVAIAQVDGRYIIGHRNWVGLRVHPHCAVTGKALLAFTERDIGDLSLEAFTQRTITDADELRAELERVRRRGWASVVGEYEDGLNGVAAPIFDAAGNCRAAVSLLGPEYRVREERLPELATLCKVTASEIGTLLGRIHHAA